MESRLNSKNHDGWLPLPPIRPTNLHILKLDSTLPCPRVIRSRLFSRLPFQTECDYCGLKKFNVIRYEPYSSNLCCRHGFFTLCKIYPELKPSFHLTSELTVKELELLLKSCVIFFCL